jgi:hypothetical protein
VHLGYVLGFLFEIARNILVVSPGITTLMREERRSFWRWRASPEQEA